MNSDDADLQGRYHACPIRVTRVICGQKNLNASSISGLTALLQILRPHAGFKAIVFEGRGLKVADDRYV